MYIYCCTTCNLSYAYIFYTLATSSISISTRREFVIEIEVRIFSFSLVLPFFLSSHAGTCDAEATRRRLVRAFLSPEEPLNGTKSERTNEPREIGVIALVQVKSRLETTNPPPSLAPPLVPFLSFFPPFFLFSLYFIFIHFIFIRLVRIRETNPRTSLLFFSFYFFSPLSLSLSLSLVILV